MNVLLRIKSMIVRGRYRFTFKALRELETDGLDPEDALESILNAPAIRKTLRSRPGDGAGSREKLYVIQGRNYRGTPIYTKGKFGREAGEEVYYLLISSKISTLDE